jgi:hypothetical protein
MSIPNGDNAFLHELELDVRAELTLIETSQPEEEAAGVPIDEWLSDPADDQRYEVNVRSLLDAVEVLEDGSRPGRCTETEGLVSDAGHATARGGHTADDGAAGAGPRRPTGCYPTRSSTTTRRASSPNTASPKTS